MSEQTELILLVINQCMMYRIKPMTSPNMKYKAAEWTPEDFLWQGKCVVVSRGEQCIVKFVDSETDAVFAQCPVGPGAVEPVIDSSRYFVVRIVDEAKGRKAFLGMGFQERGESFDFTVALQDHERRLTESKRRAEMKDEPVDTSAFELKPGQTITLNIKNTAPTAKKQTKSGLLPPPSAGKRGGLTKPKSTGNTQPTQQVQQPAQQQKKDDIDQLLFF
ncbi:NECAP PHear domain-containing protein [Entamoeba marina]